MIAEFLNMTQTNVWTELGLVLIVVMIFVFGYYAGRMKSDAKYEAELDELYEKQNDPVLVELTKLRLRQAIKEGGQWH